jgi:hypothetical protein
MVVDSTDKDRMSVTKQELANMLSHEVGPVHNMDCCLSLCSFVGVAPEKCGGVSICQQARLERSNDSRRSC